jgi:hypothetical protein
MNALFNTIFVLLGLHDFFTQANLRHFIDNNCSNKIRNYIRSTSRSMRLKVVHASA